ncbi:hypothetical protein [Planktotalea sp.]|uniref:hypothetical protein n=1 Tax=Planktotalea sp. TaxID=2029877 RepID=UPI003D6C47CF
MTQQHPQRGGAPVGFITELDNLEAATVVYLRLWSNGPDSREQVCNDLTAGLGPEHAQKAIQSFETLCILCARHGRRPLMRHSVHCKCLGGDESCFANFVAAAAEGALEDAMLFATLLVRADVAPLIASCAADFGLALKKMQLAAPRVLAKPHYQPTTLH